MISGLLISRIIMDEVSQTGRFCFLGFYCRRALRILPALFVVLFLSFLAAVILLNQAHFTVFGGSLLASVFAVSNIFFYHQAGYFDVYSQSSPLLHTWSLGVEEQFYLFWPLAILIASKFRKHCQYGGVGIMIALVFLLSIGLNLFLDYPRHNLSMMYDYAPFRAFEFCIGAALVYLMPRVKRVSRALLELLCMLGFLMVLCSVFFYSSQTFFPSYNALLPALGSALLIFSGSSPYFGRVLSMQPLRHIGLISYSLYLVHWPLIVFIKGFRQDIGVNQPMGWLLISGILLSAFFIAQVIYQWVEQPFRKRVSSVRRKQVRVLSFSLLTSLSLALLGVTSPSFALWGWRLQPGVKHFNHLQNYHLDHWGGFGFSGGFIYRGKTEHPKLVMLGDSHSGMLDTGVLRFIAKPYGITTYTASGGGAGKYASALALPGLTRISHQEQKRFDASVVLQDKDALEALRKRKDSVLLISFAYASQLNSASFLKTHQPLVMDTSAMSDWDDYKPFIHSLDRLRDAIGGRSMIIVGDVPGSEYIPSECLGQLRWFSAKKTCARQDAATRQAGAVHVNRVLSAYAKQYPSVFFINPYDVFCAKGVCQSVNAHGVPYYSDGGHLSQVGSDYLIQHAQAQIMQSFS